jgi:L-alanine-DL-glutamate epimerase-like enolase superfamily enzyme
MDRNPGITSVEIYKFDIPFKHTLTVALGTFHHAPNILVRIITEDGTYGLGESSPIWSITGETQDTAFCAGQALAKLVLHKDPSDITGCMRELESYLIHNTSIKCAFDIALADWVGKRLNIPLYTLLGGSARPLVTDVTLGIASPDQMAAEAHAWVDRGFGSIKVKLGTTTDQDVARIAAIRQEVGQETILRIDANQGWDCSTAISTLNALASYRIEYCEQPVACWDQVGIKKVRQASPVPIVADESLFDHHDALALARQEACDYFNIKLAKSGGLQNAMKINAIAEAAGIRCMIGCMFETRLALTAAAHLAAARPNIAFLDLDSAFYLADDPVLGGVSFDGENIMLPESPGLGADVSPDVLSKLEHVAVC